MSLLRQLFVTLATFLLYSSSLVSAKSVFAHYMLGDITPEHANQDVVDAASFGFDAFAVNVQDPTQTWTDPALQRLFDTAGKNNFKLFFSLDFDAHSDWEPFQGILSKYLGHSAYFTNTATKLPLVSSFGAGGMGPSAMKDLKDRFGNKIYFAPGADMTEGYYTNPDGWFFAWDGSIDGTFSWNAAWPWRCDSNPNNLEHAGDIPVMDVARNYSKGYMMGLSSHQYKRISNPTQHFYRAGEEQMPARMNYILGMGKKPGTYAPDFVQYISWNDAGESHYIGNIWPEAVQGDVLKYGNSQTFDHSAWKPLIGSFIAAYKSGQQTMWPMNSSSTTAYPVGSIWYRPLLKGASCKSDPQGKPTGWQGARDAVAYAYILPQGATGYKLNILGKSIDMKPGLNSGAVEGLTAGPGQTATLTDGTGKVLLTATGTVPTTSDSADICNFNFVVAGAKAPGGTSPTSVASPTNRVGMIELAMRNLRAKSS